MIPKTDAEAEDLRARVAEIGAAVDRVNELACALAIDGAQVAFSTRGPALSVRVSIMIGGFEE